MLSDLVIDTNVLVHAGNPAEKRFLPSRRLLEALIESATSLCVDRGFSLDSTKNQSFIVAEYLAHLRFGSPALAVLAALGSSMRIKELSRRADRDSSKSIQQMIRNKRDRTFIAVASNSIEQILVSHDFRDFQKKKRGTIKKRLGVRVLEAKDCIPEM